MASTGSIDNSLTENNSSLSAFILDVRMIFTEITLLTGTDAESKARRDNLKKLFIVATAVQLLNGKYDQEEVREIAFQMMKFASELGLKVPSFKTCMSSVAGVEIDPKAYPDMLSYFYDLPDLSAVYSVLLSLEGLDVSLAGKREEALRAFKAKTIDEVRQNLSDAQLGVRRAKSRKGIEAAFYAISNLLRVQRQFTKKDELILKSILQLADGSEEVFEAEDAACASELFGVGAELGSKQRAVAILSQGQGNSAFLRLQAKQLYLILQNHPELASVVARIKADERRRSLRIGMPLGATLGAVSLLATAASKSGEITAHFIEKNVLGVESGARYQVSGVESLKILQRRIELAKGFQTHLPGASEEIYGKMSDTVQALEFTPAISTLTASNYREVRELCDLLDEMGLRAAYVDYLKGLRVDDSAGKELNLGNYKEKLAILHAFQGAPQQYNYAVGVRPEGIVYSLIDSYSFNFDLSQEAGVAALDEVIKSIPKNEYGGMDLAFFKDKIWKNPIIEQALYDATVNKDVDKLVKWWTALRRISLDNQLDLSFSLRMVPSELKSPSKFGYASPSHLTAEEILVALGLSGSPSSISGDGSE